MPTFPTTGPVQARIDVSSGSVRVRASERSDTVVDIRPSNERSNADAQLAASTRVEFADGQLLVSSPRRPRLLFFGGAASVEIDVALPEGSRVEVSATAGDVDCEGRLGDVRIDNRYGDLRIDRVSTLRARTSAGDISVAEVDGTCEASTSYGEIRIGRAGGELRLDSACGDITVDRAEASASAKTKYGQVRVHDAARGSLDLETAYGTVEAGVREGTAAWLEVEAKSGRVRNLLTATDGPADSGETVEIRARTSYGNVVIRRA